MTENKRFINHGSMIFENKPPLREHLSTFEIVDLLNELYEENVELKKENGKIIERNNELFFKAPIWFTQSAKLTDKQIKKVAEAIEKDLKERGIKYV